MFTIVTEQPLNRQQLDYLNEALEYVGLHPDDAILRPVLDKLPAGVAPGTRQIREVADALQSELFSSNRPALLLGNTPLKAVTGSGGVTKKRGRLNGDSIEAMVSISVGAVMSTPNYRHEWIKDLSAFQQLVNPPKENVQVTIVDSPETWTQFLESVDTRGAIDIETTITENPWREPATLVSVACTFNGAKSFVFRNDEWLTKSRPVLDDVDWIMHNGLFDRLMMHFYGFDLTLKHDTMAMAYLLHEEERKGLEILSSVYLGLPPYKGVDYENILDEPFEKVARMNAVDATRTFNLFRPLADKLNENKDLSRIYQWILMPAINSLIQVTENGIPIDQGNLDTLSEKLQKSRDRLEATLRELAPDPDPEVYPDGWPKKDKQRLFNPASPQQVGHILFDLWGLPVINETATGNPSTNEETLTELQLTVDKDSKAGQFIEAMLASRSVNKQLSSYTEAWPKLIGNDGLLHPRYKPLHVVTGRLSSQSPNIQQVPNVKAFRDVFGGVEGHTWMKADYSQIELRLAAWLANEETMLTAFQEGKDLHALTAEMVLGDSKARSVGKVLNFGLLYGAGANTLRRIARMDYGLDMTVSQAKRYRENFFRAYPALTQWHNDQEAVIMTTGQAVSPLGRVRHLPEALGWEDGLVYRAVRQGINHPVQSFASDILLKSMTRVQERLTKAGYRAQIIAEVHDEIDLLVHDEDVDEVAALVKETMEDVSWLEKWGINLTVPVVADIETGTHWGSLTEWSTT